MSKRLLVVSGLIIVLISVFFAASRFQGTDRPIISRNARVKINPQAALRVIADTSTWRKWWPGAGATIAGKYVFDGVQFGPPVFLYNSVDLKTADGKLQTKGRILIVPIAIDSVLLSWTDSFPAKHSIIERWTSTRDQARRGTQIDTLLSAMVRYLSDPFKIYGVHIFNETSHDSTLVSMSFSTPDSPGTAEIYRNLDSLKAFIHGRNAAITNLPMMHIDGKPGHYVTMLAYPVNRVLPDSGIYKFKRFLPWKMISGEVLGGESTIRAGYRQFYQYIQEYGISVMANGFSFLVTDRRQEPDSSKWVTRFSAPIP